jgi:hypothetical protein
MNPLASMCTTIVDLLAWVGIPAVIAGFVWKSVQK